MHSSGVHVVQDPAADRDLVKTQMSVTSIGGLVDLDVDKLEGMIDESHRRVKHDIVVRMRKCQSRLHAAFGAHSTFDAHLSVKEYMLAYKACAGAQHSVAVDLERLKATDAISAKQVRPPVVPRAVQVLAGCSICSPSDGS